MQPQDSTTPSAEAAAPATQVSAPAAPAAVPLPPQPPIAATATAIPTSMPTHTENVSVAVAPGEEGATDGQDEASEPALLPMPTLPSKQPKPAKMSATPVLLIVVTIFFMIALSAVAVMIYMSSQK